MLFFLHLRIPVVFVISMVSAQPTLNPLVCGCLNCLCRFRDHRRFRDCHRVANYRFGRPYPRDPDILKTVRVVKLLSVVNLPRVVIHC